MCYTFLAIIQHHISVREGEIVTTFGRILYFVTMILSMVMATFVLSCSSGSATQTESDIIFFHPPVVLGHDLSCAKVSSQRYKSKHFYVDPSTVLEAVFIIQYNLHQQWDSCETDLLGVTHWQASQGYTGLNWADKYHRLCSLALQHCCIHHPECELTTSSGVPPACFIPEMYLLPKVQLKSSKKISSISLLP